LEGVMEGRNEPHGIARWYTEEPKTQVSGPCRAADLVFH